MKCQECQRATLGMQSSQIAETLRQAVRARYRPIRTDNDVVEISGTLLDRLLASLDKLAKENAE